MANPRTSSTSGRARGSGNYAIQGVPSIKQTLGSSYFSPSVHMPAMPQRNINQEKQDMRGLVRNEILMQKRYQPQLTDIEGQNALGRLRSEMGYARDAQGLYDAERAGNPMLADADAAVSRSLQSLGPSRLESALEQDAYDGLMAGGDLSAEENRDAVQAARAGFSARGLATGTSAVVGEVLNRDQFARGREQQRQGFAMGVDSLQRQRMSSDMNLAQAGAQYAAQNTNARTMLFGPGDMLGKNRSQNLALHNQTAPYVSDFANANLSAATAYNGQMIGRDLQLAGLQHDIGMTMLNANFQNQIGAANLQAAQKAGNQAAAGQIAGAAVMGVAIIF